MTIYPEGSPERDFDREQAREARKPRPLFAPDDYVEPAATTPWPEIPELKPITARPVRLTAPEYVDFQADDKRIYGECPECGAPKRPSHICPARD